jgi:hypothetical protein
MKSLPIWVVLSLFLVAGCSGDKGEAPEYRKKGGERSASEDEVAQKERARNDDGKANDQKDADKRQAQREAPTRKIIYTADLSLIVDDLSQAEEALLALIDKHKGLVAQSSITGSSGSPRQGRWRLRIPVERLEDFRRGVVKLGVPETNTINSEDVTGRYYDLEASIKTYKASEETLRKLMDKAVGKVEELLAVEKELAARREKIEQLQGELNRLTNLTALTTVNVTFHEIKNYVPPQAPTFGSRIAATFSDSVEALAGFGRGLVLVGAALAPWLPLVLVVVGLAWVIVRRRLNRLRPLPVQPLQQE